MADPTIKEAVRALTTRATTGKRIQEAALRGALPAKTGIGRATSTKGGGGIASPITETNASLRKYHADRYLYTTDGLFYITVSPIKEIQMTDANGDAVVLRFAAPV